MMKRILSGLLGTLFVAALSLASIPAEAASAWLCQPGAGSSRTIGGTGSNVPSGTLYTTNGRGCALIAAGDVAYFASQGWSQNQELASVFATNLYATTGQDSSIVLPTATYIAQVVIREKSGGAMTGAGLRIGTTSGGSDVIAGAAVGASALVTVPDVSMLKRAFSATAAQQLFISHVAAGGFASSQVDVTVVYGYF